MQPRVSAIVVVRNGEAWLDRTLEAIAGQTRGPDTTVFVDAGSSGRSAERLSAEVPARRVAAPAGTYGAALEHGLAALGPATADDEWLWLLAADTAPEPSALDALLAAVEVAPSVAVAGPKVVDPDDRALVRSYGVSISRFGATVRLVEDELDQAQHDRGRDVLAVESSGMLVRRRVFEALGGFDPGLPTADAALDLCVRARLAGHRVVRVPGARVSRVRRPEDFGRRTPLSPSGLHRVRRAAQLHRRLVWAPAAAVPLHWLSLVPAAIGRAFGQLLAKRPETVGGELVAAVQAAFDGSVPGARRRLRRTRRLGWSAIAPLRVPPAELRERRAAARERRAEALGATLEIRRATFFGGGGAAVVVIAAVVGLAAQWRLVGADGLIGGGLRTLSDSPGSLWAAVLGSAGDTVLGWVPADPFAGVLALLGTLTFWHPSAALVALWLAALPLAALGAWWCATRLSERAAPPIVAAALWALAPPLLAALADGRAGAVIAHLLLPWLVFAGLEAARSWSAAAGAALLFAGVIASAPVLAPALLVTAIAGAALRPRALIRLIGIPVAGLALFAPLAVVQVARGTPLGVFADPGMPNPFVAPSGWDLLLGRPADDAGGWSAVAEAVGLPATAAALAPALLLAPIALTALLALFLPGVRRAVALLVLALLGLTTAVASAHLTVAAAGGAAVSPWPGGGLSVYWLGLVLAGVVALEALGRAAAPVGLAVVLGATAAVAPVLAASLLAVDPVVRPGSAALPALVEAESATSPGLGTLVLDAQPDGSIAADLERDAGTTLDRASTFDVTGFAELGDDRERLAVLAGNLASLGGADPVPAFREIGVEFVLVPPGAPGTDEVRQRMTEALDANPAVDAVGDTAAGLLWRSTADTEAADREPIPPVATGILLAQGFVLLVTILLALPTGPRRRVVAPTALPGEDPADTFDEDDDA